MPTHTGIWQRFNKLLFPSILGALLLAVSFALLPPAACAEVTEPVTITGDGAANPLTLTLEQLQAMQQYQHVYSTINTWPTKKWYVGEGVKLRDLLALAEIKEDARLVIFTSTDGYSVTLTVKELLRDKRYYFPHLMDNDASDGSIPGSGEDAEEVEPILALASTEGSDNPVNMNDMDALLLLCGQRAVTEQTNNIFLKYIKTIEVLTSAPPKWDNPQASTGSGNVLAGTLIELSNKRNDADKIYYTTDGSTPTINSPIFNWSAKRWWSQRPDSLSSINKAIEIKEDTVIKAITIGPGKADSEVVTFTYKIGTPMQISGGPPSTVTLDENLITLKVGSIAELTARVSPDNATDTRVTWSSSDTGVAVVDNYGLVTAVGAGTAVVTVKTETGGLTATCRVRGIKEEMTAQNGLDAGNSSDASKMTKDDQTYPASRETPGQNSTTVDNVLQDSSRQQMTEANWQHLVPKEAAAADATDSPVADLQSDRGPGHIYEVSADSVPLQLQEENSSSFYMAIVFLVLFLTGAGRRYREYIKEVMS